MRRWRIHRDHVTHMNPSRRQSEMGSNLWLCMGQSEYEVSVADGSNLLPS